MTIPEESPSIKQDMNIGPTAFVIAHLRAISSNVRHAKLISEAVGAQETYEQFVAQSLPVAEFALVMEARYRIINSIIAVSDIHRFIELGSGLSPRGINLAVENNGIIYKDTDANPSVVGLKKELFALSMPPNLSFETLDATDGGAFSASVSSIADNQPIGVISEGLLPYLSIEKVEAISSNVHAQIVERGGCWITDIATRQGLERGMSAYGDQSGELLKRLYEQSGVQMNQMAFDTTSDAENFFRGLGFFIEKSSLHNVRDSVHTPQVMQISKTRIDKMLSPKIVWKLEAIRE